MSSYGGSSGTDQRGLGVLGHVELVLQPETGRAG
jgi:hypothetical protein